MFVYDAVYFITNIRQGKHIYEDLDAAEVLEREHLGHFLERKTLLLI